MESRPKKRRMFLVQIKTVVTVGVIVLLGIGFTLAVTAGLAEHGREFAAHERGGVYLGTEGVIMQDRSNNCGPAALKMILDDFGKCVALKALETDTNQSGVGWSMGALKTLAEQQGLKSKGWRFDLSALSKCRFPAILFVENRHFVVADSVNASGFFFLRDPAIGRIKIPSRALIRIWKGETLVFGDDAIHKE
jgi:hypothetical protein